MLPPEKAAQFGWAIVCQAVKEVMASNEGPWQAYRIANHLGLGPDNHRDPSRIVTEALKSLKDQGELVVEDRGGWWNYVGQ